jgi:NDP-sugar pyrophosphorylase family protein
LHDNFLVINGDDLYIKSDLELLIQTPNSMLVWPSQQPGTYGIVKDTEGKFSGFDSSSTLINAGAYFINTKFFETELVSVPVPNGVEYSLPHTLNVIAKSTPISLLEATRWLPVGTPEQLKFANNYFTQKNI